MIASALLKNDHMKLTEFQGTRSRLEEEGLTALAGVFKKQQSLVKIDVAQNGSKRGLAPLLEAMAHCKDTLKELVIQDNKSINRAIPELINCLQKCSKLELLNISDLNMKRKYFGLFTTAILGSLKNGSTLQTLTWNYDLSASNTVA